MRVYYCVTCCKKTRVKDEPNILICDCGNKLVFNGVLQERARELTIKKNEYNPYLNMHDFTDKSEYARKKYGGQ